MHRIHDSLRQVFNDVTRSDPSTSHISFNECESAMFRSRRLLQPRIPRTTLEFCEILPTFTEFAVNLKPTVILGDLIGVIFFSDKIYEIAADISNIQFDGTFYTVPKLFYQLWTIFFSVGKHVLPVIHCLLNSKEEELYNAVLSKIANMIPQLNPTNAMSDWEQGARNALKQQYPTTRMNGCWFHYTYSGDLAKNPKGWAFA